MRCLSTLACVLLAVGVLGSIGISGCHEPIDGRSLAPHKPGVFYGPSAYEIALGFERLGYGRAIDATDPD